MNWVKKPLLGGFLFLLAAGLMGILGAWVEVYVFHHVDPKFRNAPGIAFDISLMALGMILIIAMVSWFVGVGCAWKWPAQRSIPISWTPVAGFLYTLLFVGLAAWLSKSHAHPLLWLYILPIPGLLGYGVSSGAR